MVKQEKMRVAPPLLPFPKMPPAELPWRRTFPSRRVGLPAPEKPAETPVTPPVPVK